MTKNILFQLDKIALETNDENTQIKLNKVIDEVVDCYHNNVSIKNITNYYENETKKELQQRLLLICSKL